MALLDNLKATVVTQLGASEWPVFCDLVQIAAMAAPVQHPEELVRPLTLAVVEPLVSLS